MIIGRNGGKVSNQMCLTCFITQERIGMQFWFCLGPRITSVLWQARDFRSNTPLRFSGKGTIYEDEAKEIFTKQDIRK